MNNFKKISLVLFIIIIAVMAASCDQIAGIIGGHKHNLSKVDKIEATCTEAGQESYYVCDDCDQLFKDPNGTSAIEKPEAIAPLGHKISGVAGKEPTCTEAGVADCYQCTRCETLFSDAKGENKIDAAESVNPLGHNLVKTEAKAVSCTENGNNAYWTCGTCKKVYADAEGNTETTVADQIIESQGHSLTKTEAQSATCLTDGNIAYWSCGSCNKVFTDAEAKTETSLDKVVVKADGHVYSETLIVDGVVTEYEPDTYFSKDNLTVKLDCVNCDHYEPVTDYSISNEDKLQTTDTEIVISCVVNEKTYSATIKITVKHEHTTGDQVAAKAPTCTEEGSLAYYECTVCHEKFEDKEATKLLESIVVSSKGHSGVKTDAKPATCQQEGNNAYWTCGTCGKVFSDENCTVETTVENQKLPITDHDTSVAYDTEGHWQDCKNCDYTTEKVAHTGFAYPGEKLTCESCGAESDVEAGWENWVLYRPSTNVSSGTASRETVEGIWATRYVIPAGVTDVALEHENRDTYYAGKYQVRVPVTSGVPTYVYLRVINNSDNSVSFTFQNHGRPDDGVAISLAGKESGWFKFNVTGNRTIGDWYQILMAEGNSGADVTIYGYFYTGNLEIDNLQIANQNELKLSYQVGEKFDISNLILSSYILNSDGNALADIGAELYHIASNYTLTGLTNGQVLEEGDYTVTVSFGGKSVTLNVTVSAHKHVITAVSRQEATCTVSGHIAHYKCSVEGCGGLFADAEGNSPISPDDIVLESGHTAANLPGRAEFCTRCGETLGSEVMSGEHWVIFRPEINVGEGSFSGWNAEYTDVDGVYGSKFTFGAGVNAGDRIKLTMWNEQGTFQTIIPNVKDGSVATRNVIMYYHNYGSEAITIRFENDNDHAYDEVTIPAGGVIVSTFENTRDGGGSNWFYLQVKNDIQTDVTVGVYGYFYLDREVSSIEVVKPAEKLSFEVGDSFSAKGLMLKTNGAIKSTFVETGYTTSLPEGYVFTDADAGKRITVEVTFAGVTTSYLITVGETEQIDPEDMKIAFKPSHNLGGSTDVVSAEDVVLENGLHATTFHFKAGAKNGAEISTWPHSDGNDPNKYGYNVRVPGTGTDRKLEIVVTNNGSEAITIYYYAENNGDKGGVEVTVVGGETKTVQFTANYDSIGCNYNLRLLNDLTNGTSVTIYGYFYYSEGELTSISINSGSSHKTAYKVGEKFDGTDITVDCSGASNFNDSNIENYTTSLENGYEFTAADVGEKEITVYFNGFETKYTITVTAE